MLVRPGPFAVLIAHVDLELFPRPLQLVIPPPVLYAHPNRQSHVVMTPVLRYQAHKRTKIKGHLIEKDHIIPLSILYSNQRQHDKWFAQRPLYKFLNSDINFQYVNKRYNKEKSDLVTINGKVVFANTVRNNYPIIKYLIETLLKVSADSIIQEDQSFINQYFML